MTELQPEPGWGRTTGQTQVGRLSHGEVDRVLDRLDIAERIHRYGWGYDERDQALLGDCFTADGVWEGSIMGTQPLGPFTGREEIVAWLMTFWDQQTDQRRHRFSNVIAARICLLRSKLAAPNAKPIIFTRRGLGYILKA